MASPFFPAPMPLPASWKNITAAAKNNNGNGNGHDGQDKGKVQDFGLVKNMAGQCPECATLLVYQEGCFVCPGCGYTKC